ncbi:peptidase [Streptomyces phage SscP1EGY]|nr:peptidase [Streptomyces phage SscP1EGY]
MKWGVRKDQPGVYRSVSSTVHVEPGFHKATRDAAVEVAGLISDRYGYQIKNVKVLDERHPYYRPEYMAFVENNFLGTGQNEGTIFVQPRDMTKELKEAAADGWNAPGTGNTRGLLTHESAHSVFHSDQRVSIGLLGQQKIKGNSVKARDKALRAAAKTAKQDGQTIWDTSGYARAAGVRDELEAELFSQYHWATNPPRFVQEWGKTLHQELGLDPTPFKEVKSRG